MRSELKTRFWRDAYASLPAAVRSRYRSEIVAAERWELTLGALVDGWTAAKAALARAFQAPRERHGH